MGRHAELHFLGVERDLLKMAESLTAIVDRPVDPGKASIEPGREIAATQREVIVNGQAVTGVLAEYGGDRV